jgi:hypothetical protein
VRAAAQRFLDSLSQAQREKTVFPVDDSEWRKWQNIHRYARQGVSFKEMSEAQRDLLLDLLSEYVGNLDPGHAQVRMEEVRNHLDQTYFAWIGEVGPRSVFYYRVQSPVILIEFDHQSPIALEGPPVPSRRHVHTVVRTPNGNDYGKTCSATATTPPRVIATSG